MRQLAAVLARLIGFALDALDEYGRKQAERRRQRERAKLEAETADWWASHFDGRLPDEAKASAQADKADAHHPSRH